MRVFAFTSRFILILLFSGCAHQVVKEKSYEDHTIRELVTQSYISGCIKNIGLKKGTRHRECVKQAKRFAKDFLIP